MKTTRISRRDFVNGMAMTAASLSFSPFEAVARGFLPASTLSSDYYPPSLTGMRGSHPGSFEVAHSVAWGGKRIDRPEQQTDQTYDLVIVGAGISGLSAAWFYRNRTGPQAKILLLDNHDDFGGHAKRNEFNVNGHKLIGYGGSQNIVEPSKYSKEGKMLFEALKIDAEKFYEYHDDDFFSRHDLQDGIFFPQSSFGKNVLTKDIFFPLTVAPQGLDARLKAVDNYPLTDKSKQGLHRLLTGDFEFMPSASKPERIAALSRMPSEHFLTEFLGIGKDGIIAMRDVTRIQTAFSIDIFSAYELAIFGYLNLEKGFALIETGRGDGSDKSADRAFLTEPYIHHFPDGNAGIARLLVRQLIPKTAAGSTMEDIVTTPINYAYLDETHSNTRIRLNSTAVDVRNVDTNEVDVTYVKQGQDTQRVRAKHVILACYNATIPFICPEVGDEQSAALTYPEKKPLCYINVAINNWRSIKKAGFGRIYAPASFLSNIWMDFPISMGSYKYTADPNEPTLIQVFYIPTATGEYTHPLEQAREGRRKLLSMTFDNFEQSIKKQLTDIWGPYGFNAKKDIEAITVNRWPHGYSHKYFTLWDPHIPSDGPDAPHIKGRASIGRISIANSDSETRGYADAAIDAAWRAVEEQTHLAS